MRRVLDHGQAVPAGNRHDPIHVARKPRVVEDHDRAIDRARIVFDDDKVAKIVREQSKVQISLGWTSEKAYIFEGIVMGIKTEALGANRRVGRKHRASGHKQV